MSTNITELYSNSNLLQIQILYTFIFPLLTLFTNCIQPLRVDAILNHPSLLFIDSNPRPGYKQCTSRYQNNNYLVPEAQLYPTYKQSKVDGSRSFHGLAYNNEQRCSIPGITVAERRSRIQRNFFNCEIASGRCIYIQDIIFAKTQLIQLLIRVTIVMCLFFFRVVLNFPVKNLYFRQSFWKDAVFL